MKIKYIIILLTIFIVGCSNNDQTNINTYAYKQSLIGSRTIINNDTLTIMGYYYDATSLCLLSNGTYVNYKVAVKSLLK